MNILTFDIEEWFLEKAYFGGKQSKYAEYDRLLEEILQKLSEKSLKGTFFCVGKMATDFPSVVRKIFEAGHEIGCHSNTHQWLNKMTYDEAMEDTHAAVDALEQCVGQKVLSYRAPAFSIGSNNKWAFDILAECGIERDASVFPAVRDFGGFANFGAEEPCVISHNGHTMKEFPICMASLFGKEVAYSGGGYFRFFPLGFIKSQMKKSDYAMCYFHIDDLLLESKLVMSRKEYEDYFKENGSLINRYKRYIKANLGKKGAFAKMTRLIEQTRFINLADVDAQTDWDKAQHITL